ncbi:MAG: hypothetical protein A2511_11050 [Deltaproteobacteria bacterium RIFOXYD12_FULL_50_9]|nr:MAG: hypothetical protein A2511_11050 [Deltaproteobacteria bacterium RIFOXYD12_FULL_50_9]
MAVSAAGLLYVGDAGTGSVSVFGADLAFLGKLGAGDGEFGRPAGLAVNLTGDIFVVDKARDNVRIYDENRQFKKQFGVSGSSAGQLRHPIAITVDRGTNEVVIVDLPMVQGQYLYEGSRVQFFDASGNYLLRGFGQNGVGEGMFAKASGVCADHNGKIYVTDAYQNIVEVFDRTGKYLETIFDPAAPMLTPAGVAIGGISGRLFVGSVNGNLVDIYGIPTQYVVTAASGVGGSITPSGSVKVEHGDSASFSIKAQAGYHIENLYVDGANVGAQSEYRFSLVMANHLLLAEFGLDEHEVQISTAGNGAVSPVGTVVALHHQDFPLIITPDFGYRIADVQVDGFSLGALGGYTLRDVTTAHVVRVEFSPVTYVISATAGLNGSMNQPDQLIVEPGSAATYIFTAESGYKVAGVIVDGQQLGPLDSYTFNDISADHAVAVSFTRSTCFILGTSSVGGSIEPSGVVEVEAGTDIEFLFTPLAGYHLSRVLVDSVPIALTDRFLLSNVTIPHTIQVEYEINNYTLTVCREGNGNVSPVGIITAKYGANIPFSFQPAVGYSVADIQVDGSSVAVNDSYTFIKIAADHHLKVVFAKDNKRPVALAGPDQKGVAGIITLNGANSFDPDGELREFLWEQVEGLPVTLVNPDKAEASFSAPVSDADGTSLLFRLTVTDNNGAVSRDECLVHLVQDQQPPEASAGPDQAVKGCDTVILNGTGSADLDGSIISYQWQQISGAPVVLADAESAVASFVAPKEGSMVAALSFRLTIIDSVGLMAQSECLVNIVADQSPPVVDAGPDQIVREGEMVVLNGAGSAIAVGESTKIWAQVSGDPSVSLSNQGTIETSFSAPVVTNESATFALQLMVVDQFGLVGRDSVTVLVYKALPGNDDLSSGKSTKGQWITMNIELPGSIPLDMVDKASIAVIRIDRQDITPVYRTGSVELRDSNRNGIPELNVKFDRQALYAVMPTGLSMLTVGGRLIDGREFQQEFRLIRSMD